MKYLLLALALTSAPAFADVITCYQTEPFITEEFDTEAGTTKVSNMGEQTAFHRNVKMVIKAAGQIEFRTSKNRLIRTIDLNREGSDGMSETVYPIASTSTNGMWGGGCETSELRAKRESDNK